MSRSISDTSGSTDAGENQSRLIGLSKVINDLNSKIDQMAELLAVRRKSIMVTGQSGLGKRLLVESILHVAIEKYGKKSHLIDCTAMGRELIRSELFGYKRGAFTGATGDKIGILVQADGGIVFLDEIGDLPDDIKSGLLLVMEGREVMPVGGSLSDQKKVDLAIISATNKDPKDPRIMPVDMYNRLASYHLHIPDLSERKIDIVPLICKILIDYRLKDKSRWPRWSIKTFYDLIFYNWDNGGFRELEREIIGLIIDGSMSQSFFAAARSQLAVEGSRHPDIRSAGPRLFSRDRDLYDLSPIRERGSDGKTTNPWWLFIEELTNRLQNSNLYFTADEILKLIEEEVKYCKIYSPPHHKDPRESFNYRVFFYGLMQEFQGFKPNTYTPYVSYKPNPQKKWLEEHNYLMRPLENMDQKSVQVHIPSIEIESEDEIIELLERHGYRALDDNIRKIIYKLKIRYGLSLAEVKARYQCDLRSLSKKVKR